MVFARDLAEETHLSRALIQRPRRGLGREEGALRGAAGARPDAVGLTDPASASSANPGSPKKGCQIHLLARTIPQVIDHGVGVGGRKGKSHQGPTTWAQ